MNNDNLFDDLFEDNPFELFDFADLPLPDPFHRDASRIPTLTPLRSTGVGSVPSLPLALQLPLPPLPRLPEVNIPPVPRGQTTLPSLFSTARRQFNTAIPPIQSTARYQVPQLEPNSDDYYLNQLATRDFSSPSLPPQSPRSFGRPLGRNPAAPAPNPPSLLRHTAPTPLSGADILRRADQLVAGPFHLQAASAERRHLEATNNGQESRPHLTSTDMPPGTRSKRRTGAASDADSDLVEMSPPGPSRRSPRTRNAQPTTQTTQAASIDDDDLFDSPPPPAARNLRSTPLRGQDKKRKRESVDRELDFLDEDDIKVVDLANSDQVPDSIVQKKKTKNEVKLSAFQCVICMDDCTDLTVTHCGHLFCAECLHSSLHIDVTKKVCPICRQKIETRPASGKFNQKQKGFYNLELKLMTKKTLGKRAA